MDFEHEIRLLKIAEGIDEDIQLRKSKWLGEISDSIFFDDEQYSSSVAKLFSLLVSQLPSEDDMVTTELRKLYNTAVMKIAEGHYDPLDFERDE